MVKQIEWLEMRSTPHWFHPISSLEFSALKDLASNTFCHLRLQLWTDKLQPLAPQLALSPSLSNSNASALDICKLHICNKIRLSETRWRKNSLLAPSWSHQWAFWYARGQIEHLPLIITITNFKFKSPFHTKTILEHLPQRVGYQQNL